MNPSHKKSHSGFSLVELLVVISIVTVLISVLLPSINAARETARQSVCAGNQRQIAIAFQGYLQTWSYVYPFANPADTTTGGYTNPAVRNNWPSATNFPWMMALSPHLGEYKSGNTVKTLRCPSNIWASYSITSQNRPVTHYGLNSSTFPSNWHSSNAGFPLLNPRRDRQIKSPAATLLIGDIPNGGAPETPGGAGWQDVVTGHTNFWATQSATWVTYELNRYGRFNHNNSSWNALHVDGHVVSQTRQRVTNLAAPLYVGATSGEGPRYWSNF
jgi:prepilin-type N-terminal cleavage/methylation domain-containing protein